MMSALPKKADTHQLSGASETLPPPWCTFIEGLTGHAAFFAAVHPLHSLRHHPSMSSLQILWTSIEVHFPPQYLEQRIGIAGSRP